MDASGVARLRHLLSLAQELADKVKQEDLAAERSIVFPQLVELARLVRRFMTVAQGLPAESPEQEAAKASWGQRGQWLQEDMLALAHERVWALDAKDMTSNLLLLLYCAADTQDRALREKAEVEMAVRRQQAQLAEAQARAGQVEQLEAQAQAQATELLEARSQVAVFQQQLAQLPELNRRRQQLEVENDALRQQLDEVHRQASEQQQAIQMLMAQAEGLAHGGRAATSAAQAAAARTGQPPRPPPAPLDDAVLSSGLEANARVMDKLIALNEELSDRLNAIAAKEARAAAQRQQQPQQQQQQAAGGGGTGPPDPAAGVADAPPPVPAPKPEPDSLSAAFSDFLKG